MTNNINIKDATGRSVAVSTEDISKLNGEVVASQHIQRTASTYISGSGSAVDGSQPLTDTQLRASAVPVSVSGVSTSDKQDTLLLAVQALQTAVGLLAKLTDTQPTNIKAYDDLTEETTELTQHNGGLNVNINTSNPLIDFPVGQPGVTGMTGKVVMGYTPDGTYQPLSLDGTSNLKIVNTDLVQPLTDTQLRASEVPISIASLPVDADGALGNVKMMVLDDGSPILFDINAYEIPVRTNGTFFVEDDSSQIWTGSGFIVPNLALISAGTSGNNTIVAAVASKKIRVLALTLSFSAAVNAKFQSGAGGTDKTGLFYGTTNTQIVLPYNKFGWFETAAGALLNLNLSGAVPVGGCLTYIKV
jgi:hypothetical protein